MQGVGGPASLPALSDIPAAGRVVLPLRHEAGGVVIRLVVRGEPVAYPRPQAHVIAGRARFFGAKPGHPVKLWRERIVAAVEAQHSGPALDGPLRLDVEFYLGRPGRLCRKKDAAGPLPCVSRPDVDNLVKAVKDALSGRVYGDDCQVVEVRARKRYHAKGDGPHAVIEVREYDEEAP